MEATVVAVGRCSGAGLRAHDTVASAHDRTTAAAMAGVA
jgi:hypothetical protein